MGVVTIFAGVLGRHLEHHHVLERALDLEHLVGVVDLATDCERQADSTFAPTMDHYRRCFSFLGNLVRGWRLSRQ